MSPVYEAPKNKTPWWLYAIYGCGGCAVLLFVGIFAAGFFMASGINKASAPKIVRSTKRAAVSTKPVTLKVGSIAPSLSAVNWIVGTNINGFEAGKVYAIGFWLERPDGYLATLNVDSKLEDVVVIDVNISRYDKRNAQAAANWLKDYLKRIDPGPIPRPDKNYHIGIDDANRTTADLWMGAAGVDSSQAFIVGMTGKIEYIGESWRFLDELKKILKRSQPEPDDQKIDRARSINQHTVIRSASR